MTNFKIFLFIFLHFIVIHAKISDYRKCANKDCSEPVSLAKTLLRYTSDDSRILSFLPNVPVKIFSKEAGTRLDLWGAEINGKRGYVPSKMVRETKILKPKPEFLVPTEGQDDPNFNPAPTISTENPNSQPATPSPAEAPVQDKITPDTVTPSYEVIDGTTIYLPPGDNSSPDYSSTPASVDSSIKSPDNSSPETNIETKSITPDSNLIIDNLNPQEKTETVEEIKTVEENVISKEENSEDEEDYDEDSAGEDDENEEDEEAETSTVETDKTPELIQDKVDHLNDSKPVDPKVKETENNPASVISSPEIVEDQVDHLNDSKPVEPLVDNSNIEVKETEINSDSVISSPELVEDKVDHLNDSKPDEPVMDDSNTENNPASSVISSPEVVEDKVDHLNDSKPVEPVMDDSNTVISSSETIEDKVDHLNDSKAVELVMDDSNTENNPDSVISSPEVVEDKVDHLNDSNPVEPVMDDSNTVISSSETIEDKVDHLNDSNPFDPEPVHVESVTDTEIFEPVVAELKSEQLNEQKEEEEEQKVEEINGVPSVLRNPLNLFRQPPREDELKIDASQIQVPENHLPSTNIEKQPSSLPEQIIPTTETNVYENIPPVDDLKEMFTENPLDTSESTTETVGIAPTVEETNKINYDKAEEPTFIDTVGEKYNSLVAEDIPQNIDNLDQSIENVSDSFEEATEKITEEITENSAIVEEGTDSASEENEPSFFSKMYNSVFGSGGEQVKEETISDSENVENREIVEEVTEKPAEQTSGVYESMWGHLQEKPVEKYLPPQSEPEAPYQSDMQSCASSDNPALCAIQNQNDFVKNENIVSSEELSWSIEVPENAYSLFLYLSLTAVTVLLFSLGFYYIEKKRKDGTLISSINTLEKKLLISTKECLLLQDELKTTKERLVSIEDSSFGSNEMVTSLKDELEESKLTRLELEEQVSNLEKELENATEAGMELNKMLREMLTSQSGNVHLMQNVEHLQTQLNEQQETINSMKATLGAKSTENELLLTELTVANEKNVQLQEELDKMVVNLLSVQEEKNNIENKLEDQNEKLKSEFEATIKQINSELNVVKEENNKLKHRIEETQRVLDLKNNEYDLLKQGMKEIQATQSNKDSIMALLDVSHVKAEVQQLREEKHKMAEKLQKEVDDKSVFEKEVQVMIQEVKILKDKFEEAEKEKVEAQTRLEVLSGYFKDKEAQLQKEINENESKFMQKEGEATSTIERIKWIQEELQNYKSQNELLKKEILDQEVSLKSQISMLEKKQHDNWVLARQAERRLEESKQEASQLRNRLTIVEKNLNNSSHMADDTKMSNRIMSPLESNGEIPVSPLHMGQVENRGSPPLLFPHRDHMTTSPPLPVLPPFMPPPHGVPFMPPPIPGVPHFMPPPPSLLPGDHRLPPLGRMSSPPLHGRYSPDSRAYSPYDRDDSPPLSPSYPDSDYRRRSPPPPTSHMQRTFSPYSGKSARPPPHWERDEEREYRGPQRNKPRTHKGLSSGSGNSNESLDNSGRHSGRV